MYKVQLFTAYSYACTNTAFEWHNRKVKAWMQLMVRERLIVLQLENKAPNNLRLSVFLSYSLLLNIVH